MLRPESTLKRRLDDAVASAVDAQRQKNSATAQVLQCASGAWVRSTRGNDSSASSLASMGKSATDILNDLLTNSNRAYETPPDTTQRKIIKGMISAAFDGIFENASELERKRAKVAFDIGDTNSRFMVITPRRCGKTTAVAMFVASYIVSRPNSTTCIFSVSKRASGMLMSAVKANVDRLMQRTGGSIVVSNAETIKLCIEGTERTMSAYPASLHTLRGVGGDLIILEEAAFIPSEIIQQIVTPLLEVRGTALCCISTPMDDTNMYSKMAHMKTSSGQPVFKVMRVQMACQKCIDTLSDPTKCQHVDVIPPAWKDAERQEVSKALYGQNKQLLLRETMGIITGNVGQVWNNNAVRGFFATPRLLMETTPLVLFTMVDPSGGGGSQQAVCTVAVMPAPMDRMQSKTGFEDALLLRTQGPVIVAVP